MKANIRLWMYTPNGTVWCLFCLVWSSITYFRPKNVTYKCSYINVSGKNHNHTQIQNENKCQIINVHIKWNCLILILFICSSIYCFKLEILSGKITTTSGLFSGQLLQNIRLWMYAPNGTVWYLFVQTLSLPGLKLLVAIEAAHATKHLLQKQSGYHVCGIEMSVWKVTKQSLFPK